MAGHPVDEKFYEFMREFLQAHKVRKLAEVGSDIQLLAALRLAPSVETFYSVNFEEDHRRMMGWHEMHQEQGDVYNIELVSGNAMELSSLVEKADCILVKNVLLDLNGEDTALMWRYRRGEEECTDEQWKALWDRFDEAEEKGYREFMKVAKGGHIVRYRRKPEDEDPFEALVERLGIPPNHIERKDIITHEDTTWEAYIIKC